jgi:hypothetical protein
MELEKNVILKLISYLKEYGYPENSFALEYKIPGTNYRADLVIIDPKTNIPIMMFELKSRKSKEFIARGRDQLNKYLGSLPDNSIPTYLVFPKESEPFFEIINVHKPDDDPDRNDISNFDFKAIRTSVLSEKAKDAEDKKKAEIDNFLKVSWLLAFLVLVLLIIKKLVNFTLDTVDMALIGSVLALILIPFASKIKFLGIEFERINKAKSE